MLSDSEKYPYWFVVADESRASIYKSIARRGPIHLSCSFENEPARAKISELISDRGGRSFDSHGEGRHTLQKEKNDPKRQTSVVFARDIARQISIARKQGTCKEYALIAAPRFLGLLRNELRNSTLSEPFLAINKDVVSQPVDEIQALIDKYRQRFR